MFTPICIIEADSSFSVLCSHLDPVQIIDYARYIYVPSSFEAVRTTCFYNEPTENVFCSQVSGISLKFCLNYSNETLCSDVCVLNLYLLANLAVIFLSLYCNKLYYLLLTFFILLYFL